MSRGGKFFHGTKMMELGEHYDKWRLDRQLEHILNYGKEKSEYKPLLKTAREKTP